MNNSIDTAAYDAPLAARGRGRPVNPNKTRVLRILKGKALGQGRIKNGTVLDEVVVHRKVNSDNYVDGVTPVISRETITFQSQKHEKKVKPSNVNVLVTEPETKIPAEPIELTPAPKEIEIPA